MKKGINTSVEITDSHIKVLQAKTLKGKTVLCSSDLHSISRHSDEEVERILSGVFRSKSVSQNDIVFAISRRFAFVKHMRLPSNNDSEILKMIKLQIVNKTPYSQDEIFFKPYILEKERSGYTRLIVLIVHKEIVERYLKIFEKIGIVLNKVTLSSFGVLDWFIFQESKNKKKTKGTVVLINIDVLHSEICFCNIDKLIFSRSINYGAKDINLGKTEDFVQQVKLSLSTYTKEDLGPNVCHIKIISALPGAEKLRERLSDDFNLDVEVVAPFANIMCQKNMNISGEKDLCGISLTVGAGLLLSDMRNLVNFTPQEVHDKKYDKQRQMKWVRFFVFFVLGFSIVAGNFGLELYQKNLYLNKLKKNINEVIPEAKMAMNKKAVVDAFNEEFKIRVFVPDLIEELYKLTPQDVSYRSLLMNSNGSLTVEGYSETGSSVNDLRANMVQSSMFKEVDLKFATKKKLYKTEIADFKIIAVLVDWGQD